MATVIEHDASGVYNYGENPRLWAECRSGPSRCGYATHRTVTIQAEPEPLKPREWWLVGRNFEYSCCLLEHKRDLAVGERVRVHDADQCDRLKNSR